MPILKDVGKRLGRGRIGVVDDSCDCIVMIDGGYEIIDCELKWSEEISMSAIVVMRDEG